MDFLIHWPPGPVVFWGPVDFLIHWPPGPVVAIVQCQGLLVPYPPNRLPQIRKLKVTMCENCSSIRTSPEIWGSLRCWEGGSLQCHTSLLDSTLCI